MTLAEPKLSLRERNKLRLRAELLDAVLDLFCDDDPAALNVEAVARRVGCSKATVYVYFPGGLNDMLCAIYADISDEVNDNAMRLHDAAGSTLGRIMSLAQALMEMAARPRRGKFYAQLNPMLSPALQPVLGRSSGRYEAVLARDLSGAAGRDADALAVLLVGAMREASVRIARDPGRKDELMAGFAALSRAVVGDDDAETDG